MFDRADLRTLSGWCRRRRLSWEPALADNGVAALLLRGASGGRLAAELLLVPERDEIRLLDTGGDTMASASDLPALLDALDAGVAAGFAQARRSI